ncbi:MAG: hypothetical protein AAF658_10790, partial [Myxococcota bacterium]
MRASLPLRVFFLLTLPACFSSGFEVDCGFGTELEGESSCVTQTTCGAGTVLADGQCVPQDAVSLDLAFDIYPAAGDATPILSVQLSTTSEGVTATLPTSTPAFLALTGFASP